MGQISNWYKSEPFPKLSQPWYLNAVAKISTNKSSTKQINTDKLLSIIYDDIKISSRAMEIIMNSEQYNKKHWNSDSKKRIFHSSVTHVNSQPAALAAFLSKSESPINNDFFNSTLLLVL